MVTTRKRQWRKQPNPVFGERLSIALRQAGKSRKDLADALEYVPSSITNYLNGRVPDVAVLHEIARYLGVAHAWLTGDSDDMGLKPGPRKPSLSAPLGDGGDGAEIELVFPIEARPLLTMAIFDSEKNNPKLAQTLRDLLHSARIRDPRTRKESPEE